MKLLLVNNTSPKDREFNDPLRKVLRSLSDFDEIDFNLLPSPEKINNDYSSVIISGCPKHYSNDEIDKRAPYFEWLRNFTKPLMGICLGHQIIGRLFGAKVIYDKELENGTYTIQTIKNDPIVNTLPNTFKAALLHSCSITVPESFLHIAQSRKCKNQIMRHSEKMIYGLQFHPERSRVGITIFKNFIEI